MLYAIKRGEARPGEREVTLEVEGGLLFGEADSTGYEVELEPDRAARIAADGWSVAPALATDPEAKTFEPEPPAVPPAKRRGGRK
jgi:hypothetical protein